MKESVLIANIFSTVLQSTVHAGAVYRASEALLGLGAPQSQPCSSLGAWCVTGASTRLASVISALAGSLEQ